MGDPEEELADLRGQLDEIDTALFALVRDRMRCIERVGQVKARAGMAVFQPGRAAEVQRQAAARAREHGLDEGFFVRIADMLMAEAIRVEETVMDQLPPTSNAGPQNSPPT
jgi:chorismate mutase-like protein